MFLVADNLQIIRRNIGKAVRDRQSDPIRSCVTELEAAGAQAIDLNTGPLSRNAVDDMAFCIAAVQSATDLPVLIDTANPLAMKAGLEANRKTALINGISLEPQKLDAILPLAIEFDVDVIAYLLDERGRPPRQLDERLAVAIALYQRCQSAGLHRERMILDPVVAPLIWEDGLQRNRDLLEIIRRLPELLDGPVRTIAGLSNLTTGQGPLEAKLPLELAFACMLASAGLSWVLLNIHHRETVAAALNCRMLLTDHLFAWQSTAT